MCTADSIEIENTRKAVIPIAAVPKMDTVKTEAGEVKTVDSSLIAVKKEAPKMIIYKIQLLSSDKKLAFDSDQLKNVEDPGEYIENGIYKYTSGQYFSLNDANLHKQKLRKNGFKDAFVIATQDGKRIPLK